MRDGSGLPFFSYFTDSGLDDALSNERALLTSYSESYAKILFSYVMTRRGSERVSFWETFFDLAGTMHTRDLFVYEGQNNEHDCLSRVEFGFDKRLDE